MSASITKGKTFGATEEVTATKLHQLVDNATITGIVGSEMADNTITSGKIQSVSGASFVSLANTPSGAGKLPVANLTLADQAEAEAGTDNTKLMTPLRTKQASDKHTTINTLTEKTTLVEDDLFVIEDSADGNAKKKVKRNNIAPKSSFDSQFLHIRDQKSSGTDGGTLTAGTWHTRTLNTIVTNEISGASLSSSQFTLPAGTYYIEASAPAYAANSHRIKLRRITSTAADILLGTSEYVGSGISASTISCVFGRFTITGTVAFEIQHRGSSSTSNYGLGRATSLGTEVYADVRIWKIV
jgi:hypothetical protein